MYKQLHYTLGFAPITYTLWMNDLYLTGGKAVPIFSSEHVPDAIQFEKRISREHPYASVWIEVWPEDD